MPSDGLTFFYGDYDHPKGEVYPAKIEYRPQTSQQGLRWATVFRMQVAGSFVGQSPELSETQVNDRIDELEQAYQFDYKDCGFRLSDGTDSDHIMLTNDPFNLSGNKIVARSWDHRYPTEMANTRSFSVTIESLFLESYSDIVYFSETTTRKGDGGPTWELSNSWNGVPVREEVTSQSKVIHVQQGVVVSLSTWPLPPLPYWPLEEQTWRRTVTQVSPQFHGDLTFNKGTHYATQYAYYFERLGPDPTNFQNTWFS